jgi:hypothetical protein
VVVVRGDELKTTKKTRASRAGQEKRKKKRKERARTTGLQTREQFETNKTKKKARGGERRGLKP